jgi:hypothetical protein
MVVLMLYALQHRPPLSLARTLPMWLRPSIIAATAQLSGLANVTPRISNVLRALATDLHKGGRAMLSIPVTCSHQWWYSWATRACLCIHCAH